MLATLHVQCSYWCTCTLCEWLERPSSVVYLRLDYVELAMEKVALRQAGLPALLLSPVSIIIQSSSHYCTYQKDKRAKPGTFTQSDALTEIGENRAKKASLISVVLQRVVVLRTDRRTDGRTDKLTNGVLFFSLPTARLKGGD